MFTPISTITDLTHYPSPAVLIRDDEAGTWVITDLCIEQAKRAYIGTISAIYRIELNERRMNGYKRTVEQAA
jgi:DNA-binding LacI/PurR family transcriptional regulator